MVAIVVPAAGAVADPGVAWVSARRRSGTVPVEVRNGATGGRIVVPR